MLNYLWAGMMMLGIIYAAFTGRMPDITNAALDSSKEAITLCITMIGIMSFWVGLMEIATKAGIIEQLSRKLKPPIHFLFPNLPDNHPAATHITTNIIANILGLGWAATPAGLKAMEELKNLEDDRRKYRLPGKVRTPGTASNECAHFLSLIYHPAAHSCKCHCLPQPVRQYQSCCHRRPRHTGNRYKHIRGRDIL